MAILFSMPDGSLVPTTAPAQAGDPIEIGKPLGISLLTFYPHVKSDWGGKAEIMTTSEIRFGPSIDPAPRRINMLLQGYDFKRGEPVRDYGGDVYGDPMLLYSKAYAGQRIGITMRGVETDKISPATWKGMENTLATVGQLALFTAAAPYLAAISIAKNIAQILIKAISRNDRLQVSRADLYFGESEQKILQTGRYLLWEQEQGSWWSTLAANYKLTGKGAAEPNILVGQKDNAPYKASPYFVLQIDSKERKSYQDFEIGAGSAALLEQWGDKSQGETILNAVQKLARQVNDAKQLSSINDLLRDLKKAKSDERKAEIKAKIKAHTELFTEDNSDLLNTLLAGYLK